jgi:hypothetical protein
MPRGQSIDDLPILGGKYAQLPFLFLFALIPAQAFAEDIYVPMPPLTLGWSLTIRPNDVWITELYQPASRPPASVSNFGQSLARGLGITNTMGLGVEHSAIVVGTPFGRNFNFYLGKDPSPHGRSGFGLEYRTSNPLDVLRLFNWFGS